MPQRLMPLNGLQPRKRLNVISNGWMGFSSPLDTDPPEFLDKELAAARRAGFVDCEKHQELIRDGRDMGPCIRFGRQARFHPLKYLIGLARAFERIGGKDLHRLPYQRCPGSQ